jgi:hypothetical protein
LLTRVRRWLNDQDINDLIKAERAKHPDIATMLETLERQGADAELFALFAEYWRLQNRANERGLDDDERARRCDEASATRAKLDKVRPVTLRGVLAVLDLGTDLISLVAR